MKSIHHKVVAKLRERAHEMIDEMVIDGIPRRYIYAQLERRYKFGKNDKHFGIAWTSERCSEGIIALEDIRMKAAARFVKKQRDDERAAQKEINKKIEKEKQEAAKIRKEAAKPVFLPLTEQKKAMARLKKIQQTPWIFRWIWRYLY